MNEVPEGWGQDTVISMLMLPAALHRDSSSCTASHAFLGSCILGCTPVSSFSGDLFSSRAARVAFWCGIAIAATLAAHVAAILVVRLAGWRPPAWLEFPRAELAVLLLLLQPIAQCAGRESVVWPTLLLSMRLQLDRLGESRACTHTLLVGWHSCRRTHALSR